MYWRHEQTIYLSAVEENLTAILHSIESILQFLRKFMTWEKIIFTNFL